MDFFVKRLDLRPTQQPTLHITVTGEILPGDTKKLKAALNAVDNSDVRDVLFIFDSPGYDEQQTYINLNEKIALRMKQVAITGDSYLTLFCTDGGVAGLADLHEPKLAAYGTFEIAIDDEWHSIPQWDVIDRSDMRGRVVFDMPFEIALAAQRASTIGARVVVPGGDVYFGFQQNIRDDIVAEMIRGCPGTDRTITVTMIEQPGTDYSGYDLTTDGIRGISFARCKAVCTKYSECRAVSYVQSKSWCWPKARIGKSRPAAGLISAFKQ